jgi:hypothetical protein
MSKANTVRWSALAGSSLWRNAYRNPVSPRRPSSFWKFGCARTTSGVEARTLEKSRFRLNSRIAVFESRHDR